ncbi:hypothetical protein E2C01_020756 [Portunus trituberculatus]|uniref:Uncharacterized protein n=1 Tax=Portunus trituberculatus TaxID=210409 RepID=A0A5B7E0Q9_PORTR|nr:hypothetical protein [Portunus trituberculatus]
MVIMYTLLILHAPVTSSSSSSFCCSCSCCPFTSTHHTAMTRTSTPATTPPTLEPLDSLPQYIEALSTQEVLIVHIIPHVSRLVSLTKMEKQDRIHVSWFSFSNSDFLTLSILVTLNTHPSRDIITNSGAVLDLYKGREEKKCEEMGNLSEMTKDVIERYAGRNDHEKEEKEEESVKKTKELEPCQG